MKQKHTLIIALILLGLVIYYSFFEFTAPPKGKEETGPPLLAVNLGEVKKIEIKSSNGGELIGERNEGGWILLKGNNINNWEAKVNDFIVELRRLVEIDKFHVEDSQLKDYGLANPTFQITLTDITDKTYQLLIGDTNPVRTSVYVKFAEYPNVVLAGALLNWELEKLAPLLALS